MTDENKIEAAAEAAFRADWPKDNWKRFKPDDYVPNRYRAIVRAVIASLTAGVRTDG